MARQAEAARLPEQQVPMRRIWNRRGQNLPLVVSICHLTEGKTVLKPVGKLKAGGNPAEAETRQAAQSWTGKGGEYRRSGYMKKSDNPVVLFGRDFDEEASPIEELEGEVGQVVIRGKILTCELRELRSGNTLFMFSVTVLQIQSASRSLHGRIRWMI